MLLTDWKSVSFKVTVTNENEIQNLDEVEELVSSVSKFWSVMQDEDKDYIHGIRYALEQKLEWGNPKK